MLTDTAFMEFEGSPFEIAQGRSPGVRQLLSRRGLSLGWVAEICNCFKGVWVRVGRYGTPEQAAQAYESAAEEMRKETEAWMEAVWAMRYQGKNDDTIKRLKSPWLKAAQSQWGANDTMTYLSLDYFRSHAASETIEQIDRDAPYAAWIQRISNPGIYPSWKDYEDYEDAKKHWVFVIAGAFAGGKGPEDTRTAESMKQIPSEFFSHHTHPGSYYDAGIQNLTDISKIIWVDSVRNTLLLDIAVQPGLAKTYAILFRNLLNAANLAIYERGTDVGSTVSRTWGNALKKVWSMQFGGPNIVSNGLCFFKSASKLAVGMVLFGNTRAVGAVGEMAPEAAEPGSLQAQDFEKSSNLAFGVVASVGTLVAILGFLMSVKWRRRHSVAGASAASAPAGALLNRAVNMAQTHTVRRSYRKSEYCEVVVVRREEEGVYAS